MARYLKENKKRRRTLWQMTSVGLFFSTSFFYDIYIYSKKFPELYKTQTWKEHGLHKLNHLYDWYISCITNPADIPVGHIYACLIFTGFWTFLVFLCALEGHFLREEAWERLFKKIEEEQVSS